MTDRKFSVVVETFKPMRSNTLRGFVTIVVPELHLRIHDIGIHTKGESRWIGLPGKPQIGRDGVVRKGENGKPLYTPIIEFTDRGTHDAFSHRVIAALLEFAPAAFEEEAVS
jgi:hypothetical protein